MFRKFAYGLIAFVLLFSTTGLTCHYHYCGHTLISYSFTHAPKPCCEHPENCCHDKSVTCQFKTDYLISVDYPDFSDAGFDIPVAAVLALEIEHSNAVIPVFAEESPPPSNSVWLSRLQQYRL